MNTQIRYENKYPDNTIKMASKITNDNSYSKEDELKIVEMINDGFNYQDIADSIGRTYYGLYDKVRRIRIQGKL